MFAAAATFAQMAFDSAVWLAKYIAQRKLLLLMLSVMLPWILKGVFIWAFNYFNVYNLNISKFFIDQINNLTGQNLDVNINLTGVGGYLAVQTGLIDYCNIIITGWGMYWVVAVLAKKL